MLFTVNQAVLLVINDLLKLDEKLQSSIDDILQKKKYSCFPRNILIGQDQSMGKYIGYMAKLLIDVTDVADDQVQALVEWQVRETYRILNTAISSVDASVLPFIEMLKFAKATFAMTAEIKTLIASIEKNPKPDIVCIGHGYAEVEKGYVKNFANAEVKMYAGNGGKISAKLSIDIENDNYRNALVKIRNENTNKLKENLADFPKTYNTQSREVIPNYFLFGRINQKTDVYEPARIVQYGTGETLKTVGIYEVETLEKIIAEFPNARIHWGACCGLFAKVPQRATVGPYVNMTWRRLHKDERKDSYEEQGILFRLYKPKTAIAVSASTSFDSDPKIVRPAKKVKHF